MPLVILEGARATGKTELVKHAISRNWLSELRSFLDPADLRAARAAPRDYIFGLPHGTAIDEAQLCEEILLPVKERIEQGRPGTLLLTGSTRLRRDELGGSDPLAGRVGRPLHLGPFTLGERHGEPRQLVDQLFEDDPMSIDVGRPITRTDLINLVQEPGLPGLFTKEPEARNELAHAYIAQVTAQSSFESVDIKRVNQLARYLAGRTSTMVNVSDYGKAVELNRSTVNKYLAHLEEALLVIRLPGWRRSKDKSETDRAKLHFFDAGIAAATAKMLPAAQSDDLGRLVETALVTDLMRQVHWLTEPPACYHWRRNDQDEVDLVLEHSDGRAVCIEVKVAESIRDKDLRGVDAFREAHPKAFHRGFIFYSGSKVQPLGDNRWAIPYAALRHKEPRELSARRPSRTRIRESTEDLWERTLPRLIAATLNERVEWHDSGEHQYETTTDSGGIAIVRQLSGALGSGATPSAELAITTQLAKLAGVPDKILLTMYDADREVVSSLIVEDEPDVYQTAEIGGIAIALADPRPETRRARIEALYSMADNLLAVIEETPRRATSVADSILDDLGSA